MLARLVVFLRRRGVIVRFGKGVRYAKAIEELIESGGYGTKEAVSK